MKTVFISGSPKKKLSVSSYLAGALSLVAGGTVVRERVTGKADHARVLEALRGADAAVFTLPMFVDAPPSHLLAFMKAMETFCRENGITLRIYAVSNGGYIEGKQNAALMQIFERFCERCGHTWCGGLGIGGGVMLSVMRFVFLAYVVLFVLNTVFAGVGEALAVLPEQLGVLLFFHLGVLAYGIPFALAIRRGKPCKTRYTRVMLPSFVFMMVADVFFLLTSLFSGGLFRGWLAKK